MLTLNLLPPPHTHTHILSHTPNIFLAHCLYAHSTESFSIALCLINLWGNHHIALVQFINEILGSDEFLYSTIHN